MRNFTRDEEEVLCVMMKKRESREKEEINEREREKKKKKKKKRIKRAEEILSSRDRISSMHEGRERHEMEAEGAEWMKKAEA